MFIYIYIYVNLQNIYLLNVYMVNVFTYRSGEYIYKYIYIYADTRVALLYAVLVVR